MSVAEAKQGKAVRIDTHFLSPTLSQCTILDIEDLCRVIPAVSKALLQMYSCSMVDLLTLGQQQDFCSALSGPTKFSGTFQQQLREMWQSNT